jgi:hypothetical protein
LIEYVEKQNEIPKLLDSIKDFNPVVHAKFLSS